MTELSGNHRIFRPFDDIIYMASYRLKSTPRIWPVCRLWRCFWTKAREYR